MFFFVWFFIPETKGISLEAMDKLFGVTEDTKQESVGGPEHMDDQKTPHSQVEIRTSGERQA